MPVEFGRFPAKAYVVDDLARSHMRIVKSREAKSRAIHSMHDMVLGTVKATHEVWNGV